MMARTLLPAAVLLALSIAGCAETTAMELEVSGLLENQYLLVLVRPSTVPFDEIVFAEGDPAATLGGGVQATNAISVVTSNPEQALHLWIGDCTTPECRGDEEFGDSFEVLVERPFYLNEVTELALSLQRLDEFGDNRVGKCEVSGCGAEAIEACNFETGRHACEQ